MGKRHGPKSICRHPGRIVPGTALYERRPLRADARRAGRSDRFCHRRRPALLCARLAAGAVPQKPCLSAPRLPAQRAPLRVPASVAAGQPGPGFVGPCLRHCGGAHAGPPGRAGTGPAGGLAAQRDLPQAGRPVPAAGRGAHLPGAVQLCPGGTCPPAGGIFLRQPPPVAQRPGRPRRADAGQPLGAAGPPDAAFDAAGRQQGVRRGRRRRPGRPGAGGPKPAAVPGLFAQVCRLAGGTPPGPGRV